MDASRPAWPAALVPLLLCLSACGAPTPAPASTDAPATHEYTIALDSLRMADGTMLAVTWWVPTPRAPGERFPALLELLPYRKDDDFYARDFPLYDWFARRGFLMAKVDVRGTGGSGGALPSREYSEAELDDAVQLIAALAADPRSNGKVGMWGISWGGFNAIQVALRRPPALRAILAAHASDDLFHDDVRYIDGVLHVDRYALQIDHGNGLPRTPDYALDSAYFRDRFDQAPWILTYLREQSDGPFWRANALRDRRADLQVPAYFIGGLLDGYRDTPWRALAAPHAAPVKVDLGPWNHSWPDNGAPGPNYEWRVRAARWWDHWLRDRDTGLLDEPPLLAFVRNSHPPDAAIVETPGQWRGEAWPITGARVLRRALGADAGADAPTDWRALRYTPGSGTAAGEWWGEPTGDQSADDARALTFDLAVDSTITLLGVPRVRLVVRQGAPLAHWVARLEDLSPDGRSALITGGAMNVTHRRGTLAPIRAVAGAIDTLTFDLHVTSWQLPPGHRLRVAITNAQFPMLWPTPFAMTTAVDPARSWVELPVVPNVGDAPLLPTPHPRARRPDVTFLRDSSAGPVVQRDAARGETSVRWLTVNEWTIGDRRFREREEETYRVRDAAPEAAGFAGTKLHRIALPGRTIEVETRITIQGERDRLQVTVRRTLRQDGRELRRREWREAIPRSWH